MDECKPLAGARGHTACPSSIYLCVSVCACVYSEADQAAINQTTWITEQHFSKKRKMKLRVGMACGGMALNPKTLNPKP